MSESPIFNQVVADLGYDPTVRLIEEEVHYTEDPVEEAEEQTPRRNPTAAERRKARQRPAPGTVA